MGSRNELIDSFLNQAGLKAAERIKIPGDASFRKYEIIKSNGKEYILMDSPPDTEDVRPFIKIDEILLKLGLSAPEILNQDINSGFLLLENFGDKKFNHILKNSPSREEELYELAVDVLAELYQKRNSFDIPDYSKEKLINEAMLMPEWYIVLFEKFSEEKLKKIKSEYKKIISRIIDKLQFPNDIITLRDYHADNLMLLSERIGFKSVGLLDFQDAVIGNIAYDLVSLLEDARRDVSQNIQSAMIDYFLDCTGLKSQKEAFISDYNILGAQRNLKIIGIFSRLKMRDGKESYLSLIPRVKSYLKQDLQHEALKELKEFLGNECNL